TATPDDWAVVARRMAKVPEAFTGYTAALTEGSRRGLHAAPRQVETVVGQLDAWLGGEGGSWFHAFAAKAPDGVSPPVRSELTRAADAAAGATAALRGFLANTYLPATEGTPDAVGVSTGTGSAPASRPARTSTSPRRTRGAGRSTGVSPPRCSGRPRPCCRAPTCAPRCVTTTRTDPPSRASRRCAPGCSS